MAIQVAAAEPSTRQRDYVEQADSLEIILKITERCNINCTYCYMFNRGNDDYLDRPAVISTQWITEGVARLKASRVSIILHGGEPMMLKKRKFREMCEALRSSLDGVASLQLGMQTNAILVDDEWIDLISEFDIALGVSLDGPPEVNDQYRIDKKGRGTHHATLAGLARLQDAYNAGRICKPGIICVINPNHSAQAAYRHIVDELQITSVSFNLPMETHDTLPEGDAERFQTYLLDLFEEWTADDNPKIHVRIFDQMFRFFAGDDRYRESRHDYLTDHVMVVIASDGTLSEHDDFKVINFAQRGGNIRDTTLYEFANSSMRRYLGLVNESVPTDCQACDWRAYCRAGVSHGLTVTRFSEANGFDNRSALCGAFAALFDRGARYLLKNGLPIERLRSSLSPQRLSSDASGAAKLRVVPRELFS